MYVSQLSIVCFLNFIDPNECVLLQLLPPPASKREAALTLLYFLVGNEWQAEKKTFTANRQINSAVSIDQRMLQLSNV